jgi:hypothetical protein
MAREGIFTRELKNRALQKEWLRRCGGARQNGSRSDSYDDVLRGWSFPRMLAAVYVIGFIIMPIPRQWLMMEYGQDK